jgi:hypothetical protein
MKKHKKYRIETGGIWDNREIDIYIDYLSSACPHSKNGAIPLVVVATNEGGYNSTGVCAECIAEAVDKIKNNELEPEPINAE